MTDLPTWPAPERNWAPILAALSPRLPQTGELLEIASGTGQHAVRFAEALPEWTWQPTDMDPEHRATIQTRIERAGLANLRAPVALDVRDLPWPIKAVDAIYCANMIHIAPWEAAQGLFAGAGQVLRPAGRLFLYGPFRFKGHTVPSNEAFHASLQRRDSSWGVRDLAQVAQVAAESGLSHDETIEMPANNHLIVFTRWGNS